MSFDIIAAITLSANAVATPALLILGSRLEPRQRGVAAAVGAAWLALLVALAATRDFAPAAIGAAVLLPLLAVTVGLLRGSATVQALAATPLLLLVALHVTRVLGVDFLILHEMTRLPPSFAHSAGYGDIITGVVAVPVALMIWRQAPGWRIATLLWNLFGTLDLVAALTLGTGSAPGSPLRFIYEEPANTLMGQLPWLLIPCFLVPIYLVMHVFVFVRLLGHRQEARAPATLLRGS